MVEKRYVHKVDIILWLWWIRDKKDWVKLSDERVRSLVNRKEGGICTYAFITFSPCNVYQKRWQISQARVMIFCTIKMFQLLKCWWMMLMECKA